MRVGDRFKQLLLVAKGEPVFSGNQNRATWLCRCDCGTEKTIRADSIRRGFSQSCGCLQVKASTTHGHYVGDKASSTYTTWKSMLERVDGKYAELGIEVCERWRSFENFLADMGERPSGKTLDREDNSGNYEPNNCRWATPKQQARNRQNTLLVEYQDEEIPLAEACEIAGAEYNKVWRRYRKFGWTLDRALS